MRVLICIILTFIIASHETDNDEGRPYEFGFTIDGQQHRHERKDQNGIIQGEFGFITADGVYHVTVYATDENGNFKILSMKNIRISAPLDGSPATGPISPEAGKYLNKVNQINPPNPPPRQQLQQQPVQSPHAVTRRPSLSFTTQPTIRPACAGCGYVTTPKPVPGQTFLFQNQQFSAQKPQGPVPQNNAILLASGVQGQGSFGGQQNNLQSQRTEQHFQGDQSLPNAQSFQNGQSLQNGKRYQNGKGFQNGQGFKNGQSSQNGQNIQIGQSFQNGKGYQKGQGFKIGQSSQNGQNFQIGQSFQNGKGYQNGQGFKNGQSSQNGQSFQNRQSIQKGQSFQNRQFQKQNKQGNLQGQQQFDYQASPEHSGSAPFSSITSPGTGFGNPGTDLSNQQVGGNAGTQLPNEAVGTVPNGLPTSPFANGPNPLIQAGEVSKLPPISISNSVIHVGGKNPKDIPINDKFPGMVEGLPNGVEETDVKNILYKFKYTVGFHGHYEKGLKNGAKVGGYFVNGRDGISRVVTYVADENGYRPKFKFINLGLSSDDTPKEGSEKKFGLKSFEFVWYPIE